MRHRASRGRGREGCQWHGAGTGGLPRGHAAAQVVLLLQEAGHDGVAKVVLVEAHRNLLARVVRVTVRGTVERKAVLGEGEGGRVMCGARQRGRSENDAQVKLFQDAATRFSGPKPLIPQRAKPIQKVGKVVRKQHMDLVRLRGTWRDVEGG